MTVENERSFLKRAETRAIRIGSQIYKIWMVLDMDALIEDFIVYHEQNDKRADLGCPYGATLWPSTRAFADWAETQEKKDKNYFIKFEKALELGCGVGVASCILAKMGIKKVIATDAETDLAWLIEKNAELFHVSQSIQFESLKWGDDGRCEQLGTFPLVTAFDVLYEREHIRDLPRTAHKLLSDDGLFILGDPRRFCFESAIEELKKYFKNVEMTTVPIEHESSEAMQGVINRDTEFTPVEMILCSGKKSVS